MGKRKNKRKLYIIMAAESSVVKDITVIKKKKCYIASDNKMVFCRDKFDFKIDRKKGLSKWEEYIHKMCDPLKSKRELSSDDENKIDNMKSKLVNIIKKKDHKNMKNWENSKSAYI